MDYRIIELWSRKKLEKVQYYKNTHSSQFYIEIQCGFSIKIFFYFFYFGTLKKSILSLV